MTTKKANKQINGQTNNQREKQNKIRTLTTTSIDFLDACVLYKNYLSTL